MADLGELFEMNEVFSQYFPEDPPARTNFECSILVADARVEIEAIAFVQSYCKSGMDSTLRRGRIRSRGWRRVTSSRTSAARPRPRRRRERA